jgi:DNA (cytosine-5)-methyltransferase 1
MLGALHRRLCGEAVGMTRPLLLLDLFHGVGGAAVGYHRAGFEVVGVDTAPPPEYPFESMSADAFEVLASPEFIALFDLIHASPVCKRYTVANRVHGSAERHPDQIAPTRAALEATGKPYVIENVVGAPLLNPVTLCGSMFGLGYGGRVLRRHRLFESNMALLTPPDACKGRPAVGVYGTGGGWTRTAPGGGGVKVSGAAAAEALGIDWSTRQAVLSQAIPPAYTEHLGSLIIPQLPQEARA